jgi:hypothetical protein
VAAEVTHDEHRVLRRVEDEREGADHDVLGDGLPRREAALQAQRLNDDVFVARKACAAPTRREHAGE